MNAAITEMAAGHTASWRPAVRVGAGAAEVGSFAQAMAAVDIGHAWPNASLSRGVLAPSVEPESALGALARQLDEAGRRKVEAQRLSAELAGAWATGVDAPTLAVSMHRQARAMASYNLSVMWGAKVVGVTAGALRQLVAST
ncbi:hypothetical protein [Trinickia sp.]|uniref:hypothetical protein n=1 Tax=Trinickia sp. TaxID=2571163 RepID=UPI003F7D944F